MTLGSGELTNARTRIVGTREGRLADAIVAVVHGMRSVFRGIRRLWSRLTSVVTVVGWCVGLVVVAAFIAGYVLGWSEALIVAWVGAALIVLALGYLVGSVAYEARLVMPMPRVVVGTAAPVDVIVTNPTHRGLLAARVEVPVGRGVAEFAVPGLRAGGRFEDVFMIPTEHRGVVTVGPVRSVRADPLGMLRRAVEWKPTLELFVHPATIAIPSMSTGFVRDLEGNPTRDLTSSDVSFHALREYTPGDERRSIHWKSTAKTGSFMVRQFEETRRSHLLVGLSLAESDYADDEEFELAVSAAGSLGVRAIRDGRTVSVAVSAATPEFAKHVVVAVKALETVTPTRLLDDLTRIRRSPDALRLIDVARVTATETTDVSIAFLVCGSTVAPAQLRHASSMFSAGVEVVAVVCDPGATPGLRRVADLSVLTIGFLDDLFTSLARSRAA